MLVAYFALAFAIAWGGILLVESQGGGQAAMFLCMIAGPSLASLSLTAAAGGLRDLRTRLLRLRGPWLALLVAPVALAESLLVLAPFSKAFWPTWNPLLALAGGLGAGIFEELGWTGFATPRLLRKHGVLRTGVILGLVWATWHALADWLGTPAWGALWPVHFAQWYVALVAYRVLMSWAYARAQSIPLGMAMHAVFTGGQLLLWPAAPPALELVWYGLFGLALWAAVLGLFRRREQLVSRAPAC